MSKDNNDDKIHNNQALLEAFGRIGKMEGRMDSLENRVIGWEKKIEARLTMIESRLEELITKLNEGKGAWKFAQLIGWSVLAAATLYPLFFHK